MVKMMLTLTEHEKRVVDIVKGQQGFKNKNQAIAHIIKEYEMEFLEPELRPEFIEKMKRIEKEPTVKIKNFKQHFGL